MMHLRVKVDLLDYLRYVTERPEMGKITHIGDLNIKITIKVIFGKSLPIINF